MDILFVGGVYMDDKNKMARLEDLDDPFYSTTDKVEKTSFEDVGERLDGDNLDKEFKDDRHNENARAAAALEQDYPRINTEHL